jgi:hypothetical protein
VACAAALCLLAGFLSTAAQQTAWAAACAAGTESDFNGDGIRDVAIADPEATVNGKARAGVVHVVYGGGKGEVEVDQDLSWVPGAAEAGDRFGFSLATYDADLDGCGDLAVGAPYEAVGPVANSGAVYVLHGSPTGLADGPAAALCDQTHALFQETAEQDDLFGYALAAGNTVTGQPFLVIGVPGEDLGSDRDAGIADYLYGTSPSISFLSQDSPGVGGDPENDDRFGASLAADASHLVVGVPGEAVGPHAFAGAVHVFSHMINTAGIPTPLFLLSANSLDSPDDTPQTGDEFGVSVAMVPYISLSVPSGSATDSKLVVGVPGKPLAGHASAGEVLVFHVSASGTVTFDHRISQAETGVQGGVDAGDRFGQKVAAVGQTSGTAEPGTKAMVAIGVPGEDTDAGVDAGGVEVFSLKNLPPGGNDVWIAPEERGVPGSAGARDYIGMSVASGGQLLYVGVPYGDSADRAVLGIPWSQVDGTTSLPETIAPITVWKPGQDGIPAGGVAFGTVVR